MSERVLNQHFNDDKLYHFQANIWHSIKVMPLSVLRNYVEVQDLPQTLWEWGMKYGIISVKQII